MRDIETAVLRWYETAYNTKPLFAKPTPILTPKNSINTGSYPWVRETGHEILESYFQRFTVDSTGFNFITYWPYEKGILPNWLRPKSQKVPEVSAKPLTLGMLIESAKAGRWLYD